VLICNFELDVRYKDWHADPVEKGDLQTVDGGNIGCVRDALDLQEPFYCWYEYLHPNSSK